MTTPTTWLFTYDTTGYVSDAQHGLRFITGGARSSEPDEPTITQLISQKLDELESQNLYLTQEGFRTRSSSETVAQYRERRASNILLDQRAIQLALTDIPKMFVQELTEEQRVDKIIRPHTSYGLKHCLAHFREELMTPKYRRGYITNGDFIMALLLLGYPCRQHESSRRSMKVRGASLAERVEFGRTRQIYTAFRYYPPEYYAPKRQRDDTADDETEGNGIFGFGVKKMKKDKTTE